MTRTAVAADEPPRRPQPGPAITWSPGTFTFGREAERRFAIAVTAADDGPHSGTCSLIWTIYRDR
jgi:hypothetical protein